MFVCLGFFFRHRHAFLLKIKPFERTYCYIFWVRARVRAWMGDWESRRRLSVAMARAICLINMMKMIFIFTAQTTTSQSKCMKWEKKDYIRLLYPRDNKDDDEEWHRQSICLAHCRCIRKKGAEEFEPLYENGYVFMRFDYNFLWKLPLPRAQREILPLQRYQLDLPNKC